MRDPRLCCPAVACSPLPPASRPQRSCRARAWRDWRPTETVRLIVPAAAGGSTDVMGRLLAAHLQTAWGQSAVVENSSGGGGTIGTAEVVRSKR